MLKAEGGGGSKGPPATPGKMDAYLIGESTNALPKLVEFIFGII